MTLVVLAGLIALVMYVAAVSHGPSTLHRSRASMIDVGVAIAEGWTP